jgi:transcriptional regulator with XRE-family HTH domain
MGGQLDLSRQFGRNLARLRRRAGVSQEELGFLANLHRTEVGMLERGVRLPRLDTLLKIAGALELEMGELVEGMGWTPSDPRVGTFEVGGEDVGPAR